MLNRISAVHRCVLLAAVLAGCATQAPEGALIADPYEATNREIHAFNTGLDTVLLRPVSQAYDAVTPATLQFMIGNGASHLRLPVIFFNNLLQGEFRSALATLGRFGVNTVAGAGGLLDPATEFGLPLENTDFGLTLASHGAEEGPYLVLPIFGPSTGRDAIGVLGNIALDPLTYISIGSGTERYAITAARVATPIIDTRARNADVIDDLLYGSEDSYVALRSAYVQNRRRAVSKGQIDPEAVPDIFAQ